MLIPHSFRAIQVLRPAEGFQVALTQMTPQQLPEGELLVKVAFSSLNYKDALACSPEGKVVRTHPMVPGIDLAGTVVESAATGFSPGDRVLATGYELGVAHYGGFAEYARIPASWAVPLPSGLTEREAMALGTAGFTAALSLHRLEQNGLTPAAGEVLVTGASGGVGSLAVAMLARRGYTVAASTGKESEHAFLQSLGVSHIIPRGELLPPGRRPLEKTRWAAAVDCVGGETLAYVLSAVNYGGSVAASGLTGGTELPATVFPFILRGVNLLGIDSVHCPAQLRHELWQRLSGELKPSSLESMIRAEIALEEVPNHAAAMLQGQARGRTIVKLCGE